jgi:release factor glutamine methyltransferase
MKLTPEQIDYINRTQIERLRSIRQIGQEGITVHHRGLDFKVLPGVFPPFDDSLPLLDNYVIERKDRVLDICTGSGVIAINSALRGAYLVVALDKNPNAVACTKINVKLHGVERIVDPEVSDVYSALKDDERFNVITANLPFRDLVAEDEVQATMWDTGLKVHKKFFEGLDKHLMPKGRVYLAHANFGAVDEMRRMASAAGFKVKQIGEKSYEPPNPRIFYAFELRRKIDK